MKPVERSGFVDFWILIQQGATGMFNLITTNSSAFGTGIYATERDAQHAQTIELLKGNRVEVFHIEWPIK